MIDLNKLADFLKEANKQTYANKEAPKSGSLRPSSEDYHFEQGDLVYHDTYFGGKDFLGEEVVYQNEKPLWGMNYYGFMLTDEVTPKEINPLLRAALGAKYDDYIPVRGPALFENEIGVYKSSVDGKLDQFIGTEEIEVNGEVVYRCWYHGGIIQ